jgi:hypothetical protein
MNKNIRTFKIAKLDYRLKMHGDLGASYLYQLCLLWKARPKERDHLEYQGVDGKMGSE